MKTHLSSLSVLGLCLFAIALSLPAHAQTAKAVKKSAVHQKQGVTTGDAEEEFTNFGEWRAVAAFIDKMSEQHGFDRAALHGVFARAHFSESVVKLINPPPATKTKNWTAYHERFVEPVRIRAGVKFWNDHAQTLARAEAEYGVPTEIIVGILGVETLYGRMSGKYRVMDALTTLGFAYPETPNRAARMRYFEGELEHVLLYARENNIDPFSLLGSFAGAIGWPQFMPGSIRNFAVDFDGDGKIDLRNSPQDAIGSIANFLVRHGWRTGLPLVFPASVPADEPARWQAFGQRGLVADLTLNEFDLAGISAADMPPADLRYGLVDLQDDTRPTRYWLGTENFFAITKYNRSYFYAMSVIKLGEAVKNRRTP